MIDDTLTFTLRLYDPMEKIDPLIAASWVTVQVPRSDLTLPQAEFIAKYIVPNLAGIKQLKLK